MTEIYTKTVGGMEIRDGTKVWLSRFKVSVEGGHGAHQKPHREANETIERGFEQVPQ